MAVRSLAQSTLRQNPQINSMLAGYQPNAFHHLETVRLGGNATSIEFANLARYSDYQHLQIRSVVRMGPGGAVWTTMRFNGDSGSNYSDHGLVGTGSGVGSNAQTSGSSMRFSFADSNQYVATVVDILDAYDSSKFKTIRSFLGVHGFITEVQLRSGNWRSTAAINSLSISCDIALLAGSRFSLYGIKARA